MRAGVLALQGDFLEHEKALAALGVESVELRARADLEKSFDLLVLPGGESTVQGKLLRELNMLEPLKERIAAGLPTLATCAGLILLAQDIEGGEAPHLATLPVTVRRNAYGRQLGSFHHEGDFGALRDIPMTFIRAPYIKEASAGVEILATVEGKIVAARYQNQTALAFHPELDGDTRIYENFLHQSGLN